MRGLVFNIQRYSIHDGQGIRTIVFLKGCPLRCPWCCNPESQSFEIEQAIIKPRCINCKDCSRSVEECPSGAFAQFGKFMSSDEVVNEVMKDSIFYTTSGGGVTLSGGEVLMQTEFVIETLKKLKELGVNTAIETCGIGNNEGLIRMAEYLDLILFDLKIMDEKKSKDIIGADINIIKENIKSLVKMKKVIIPRIPLIPGYTMDRENIEEIIKFVNELNLNEIHLLPFHQYGSNKYKYLNNKYIMENVKIPSEKEIKEIRDLIEKSGIKVVTGGL